MSSSSSSSSSDSDSENDVKTPTSSHRETLGKAAGSSAEKKEHGQSSSSSVNDTPHTDTHTLSGLPDFPDIEEKDHCETPPEAYQHVTCVLEFLCKSKKKKKEELLIYGECVCVYE
jgi:hypothetical protein